MLPGLIGYGQPGNVISTLPVGTSQNNISGTVWGDCPNTDLKDEGNGFFVHKDFKDDVTLPGLPSQNGTFTIASSTDSALNIQFSSTANVVVYTQPMAPVVPAGNSKMWYEVSISPQQSTAQTFFFGLVNSTGLSSTLIHSSTTLLSTASLIGFFLHADAPTNLDAVYQNGSVGSTITILASVLTANANNPNPANVNYVPQTAPGAFSGTGSTSWVKLGLRTDKTYVYFYVNGTQIAKKQLDSTFDIKSSYGGIIAAATGTSNTDNLQVSFLRVAGKIAGQI